MKHYVTLVTRDGAQKDITVETGPPETFHIDDSRPGITVEKHPPRTIRIPVRHRPVTLFMEPAPVPWKPIPDEDLFREYEFYAREAEKHWIYREVDP